VSTLFNNVEEAREAGRDAITQIQTIATKSEKTADDVTTVKQLEETLEAARIYVTAANALDVIDGAAKGLDLTSIAASLAAGEATDTSVKTLGEVVAEQATDALKSFTGGEVAVAQVTTKNLNVTESHSVGAFTRNRSVEGDPTGQRPVLRIADLFPAVQVTENGVEFVALEGLNPAGDFVLEYDVNTQSFPAVDPTQYSWTLKSALLRGLRAWTPASKRALSAGIRTYVDTLLAQELETKLDRALLVGTGDDAEIRGLLNTPGVVTVSHVEGTSAIDQISLALEINAGTEDEADFIVLNPADWGRIERSRENGAEGAYLYGGPATAAEPRIWGKPVVLSAAVPAGQAVLGSRSAATVFYNDGLTVSVADQHADFAIRGAVALVAELGGVVLAVTKPRAFQVVELYAA
jgi:hypothetical protein